MDSATTNVTVDGTTANGCTFHGEQAVSLPTGTTYQNYLTLFSDGAYVGSLGADVIVTVNYVCPPPDENYSAPFPLGLGWGTITDSPMIYLVNNRMQGNYTGGMPPSTVTWIWDFAPGP